MIFRAHKPDDARAIESLFTTVFTESDSEKEGLLVGKLGKDLLDKPRAEDLIGFVGEDGEGLVACILFSRLIFSTDISAFLLAPVAVQTAHQGKGIGKQLIQHGVSSLRDEGVKFAITYGDPRFYGKVGFQPISPEVVVPPFPLTQPEGWLGQSLQGDSIESLSGKCSCVPAFNNPAYW